MDAVGAILSRSERQVEVAGQNVSNVGTPGYKRLLSFEGALDGASAARPSGAHGGVFVDFTPGKLMDTGRAYDLAIAGSGFFVVGSAKAPVYTRHGQFDRDQDGRLVNGQGLALQVEGGGDLVLKSDNVKVAPDGSVLEGGTPVGKIAVVSLDPLAASPIEDGNYSAPDTAVSPIDTPRRLPGQARRLERLHGG